MRNVLIWIKSLLRPENIKAIAGSMRRRILGLDFLKMRIALFEREIEPSLVQGDGMDMKGYSENLMDECIELLNDIGSLGLWSRASFRKRVLSSVEDPKNDIFILAENGLLIGFAVIHKRSSGDNFAEVGYVAIKPQRRGKGLGQGLLMHILSQMKKRGISYAHLRTDSFRLPAIKAYLRCGFSPSAEVEDEKRRWQRVLSQMNHRGGAINQLRALVNPNKIHKLKLTNEFDVLRRSFFKLLFGKLARSERTREFEDAFRRHFRMKEAIAFPHARTALHFILKSMNFEKGSEVLMAPLTIADMVNSIHTLGLKPKFVDIELSTLCMDLKKLKDAITPNSKAVLITYLFGLVPDIEAIEKVAREHGLAVIEDCSQAFDASYKGRMVGTFGDAAFFSLTNFKVCSSLFGGMIITNDEGMTKRLRGFRETGLLPAQKGPLLRILIKDLIYSIFFSKRIFSYFTYFVAFILERINPQITYRLYSGNIKVLLGGFKNELYNKFPEAYLSDYTDVQAEIGLASLSKAQGITSLRIRNGERLSRLLKAIPDINIPDKLEGAVNVYWRFPIISDDLEGLKGFLLKRGIDSASTYLTLCSNEPGFEVYSAAMPNAERFKKGALIVEVNEGLREGDIDFTASLIRSYFESAKANGKRRKAKRPRSLMPTGLSRLLRARCLGDKFPHAIQLNITFRCNQRCLYCGVYSDKRDEMTTTQIRDMINEFVDLGTSRLSITGGEPLLRDDLQAVVQHAKRRGLFVALSTNGSLIPQKIDQLEGVDSIDMTLDGPEAVHDRQRGDGNFKKVLEAASLIKEKKIPLYFVSVLTKNNCAILDEVMKLAKSLDTKLVIQPVFYSEWSHANNPEGYAGSKYDDGVILEALNQLIRLKGNGDQAVILSRRYYQDIKRAIANGKRIRCRNAGRLFCTISPDGRVAPCNLLVRDSLWFDGKKVGFRKAFLDMPQHNCGGCLSSFLDIDDLYSLKPDVAWNYYKHYLRFFRRP